MLGFVVSLGVARAIHLSIPTHQTEAQWLRPLGGSLVVGFSFLRVFLRTSLQAHRGGWLPWLVVLSSLRLSRTSPPCRVRSSALGCFLTSETHSSPEGVSSVRPVATARGVWSRTRNIATPNKGPDVPHHRRPLVARPHPSLVVPTTYTV